MREKKILVVDDEAGIRDFLKTFLDDRGYAVLTAEDGQVGLSLIEQENPDLVIVDLKMPTMGGIEMLTKIQESHIELKIIVITAMDDLESRRDAEALGITDYVLKPLNLSDLEEIIIKKFYSEVEEES